MLKRKYFKLQRIELKTIRKSRKETSDKTFDKVKNCSMINPLIKGPLKLVSTIFMKFLFFTK